MAYSTQWLNVVRRPRMRLWKLPAGSAEPLMPWITPPVPPELEALFRAEGQVRQLNGGEYVYTKNDSDTSVAVDLEEAYLLASAADTWINVGPCNTLAELTAQNPKFAGTIPSTPGGRETAGISP